MNKTIKILSYTFFIVGLLALIAIIATNKILENKIKNYLEEDLPKSITSSYYDVSVNTLNGAALIAAPNFVFSNPEDGVAHTFFKAANISVSGFSFWDFIFNKEIHIKSISIDSPSVEYFKDRVIPVSDSLTQTKELEKTIFIEKLKLHNAQWKTFDNENDSLKLSIDNLSLEIDDIHLNQAIINRKIPLEYTQIYAEGDSLFLKVNNYDILATKSFQLKGDDFLFNEIKYYTKYSKPELSKILKVQRDHYDLNISSLAIKDFNYGFKDTVFNTTIKKIKLKEPQLEIFRNKLLAEDLSIKPLYSKSLRELPFDLTVDSVQIVDGYIKYEERVKAENTGGHIQFQNLDADMTKVSNTYQSPERTDIKIKAVFMDNTPIEVDWNFDVNNKNDQFLFQATVDPLEVEKLNKFTAPNLGVRLEGRANKTFFTIDGNNDNSVTDLKINYSNFKIELLRKDGQRKNKFLSAVLNIFVSKDSEQEGENYKEGTGETARNKTKSFFNLLWISIQSALQKIIL